MRLFAVPALVDNYIWIAADDQGAAVVVDPGQAEPVEALLARENLHLTTILLTHHHHDHTGGVAALAMRHELEVIAPTDPRIEHVNRRVQDSETVELDSPQMQFGVIEVPGHTSSHVAYHGEGLLFCGDTLFSLGCGRLFEGTPAQMLASLDRLSVLPGETKVCCGHEYTLANAAFAQSIEHDNAALWHRLIEAREQRQNGLPTLPSRLADEREANPFLRIDSAELKRWAEHAQPSVDRVQRFAALREAKDRFRP